MNPYSYLSAELEDGIMNRLKPGMKTLRSDLVSGFATGLFSIPEGMAYANPDGSRANTSRDFIGQGLGNLIGSFFQSMGTGGSLSRTGISVGAVASSRWGGIFAGLWLALIVLLFGKLAEIVPVILTLVFCLMVPVMAPAEGIKDS